MAEESANNPPLLQQIIPPEKAPDSTMAVTLNRSYELKQYNTKLHPQKRKDVRNVTDMLMKSIKIAPPSSYHQKDYQTSSREVTEQCTIESRKRTITYEDVLPRKIQILDTSEEMRIPSEITVTFSAVGESSGSAFFGQTPQNVAGERNPIAANVENKIVEENRTSSERLLFNPTNVRTDKSRDITSSSSSIAMCTGTSDSVESLALNKHKEVLQHYCRMCCRKKPKGGLKPAVLLKLYLSEKLMKDFTLENSDVYPTKFCHSCINKMKKFQRMSPEEPFPFQFHSFRPHDPFCELCSDENVLEDTLEQIVIPPKKVAVTGGNSLVVLEGNPPSIMSDVAAIQQCNIQRDILAANASVRTNVVSDDTTQFISRVNKKLRETCIRLAGNNRETSGEKKSNSVPAETVAPHVGLCDDKESSFSSKEAVRSLESFHEPNERVKSHNAPFEKRGFINVNNLSTKEIYTDGNVPVVGIPLAQVTESQRAIAKVICCNNCELLPFQPFISRCSHIFCKSCVGKVTVDIHKCTNVGGNLKLSSKDIWSDFTGLYTTLVSTFLFKCKNVCNFVGNPEEVINHQNVCTMEESDEVLVACEREARLKIENFLEYGDRYCEDNKVNQEYLLFYSLRRFLKLKGDKKRVALLMRLWEDTEELGGQLSPEDCLALRVTLGQRLETYAYHYNFLKRHVSISNLRSPKQIEQMEKMFYPPFTDFSVESQEGITLYKRVIDDTVMPSDLGELMSGSGFRWKFTAAVAKTLQELAFEFQDKLINLPNARFIVNISDKYEKVKDLRLLKLRKNNKVPKYVIRYSFCVLTITLVTEEGQSVIYSIEKEKSSSLYRTIAIALPHDFRKDNVKLLLHPIEEEKRNLGGKHVCIRLPNGMTGKFWLNVSSVINYGSGNLELVSLGNLDVNEYGEFCMLCHTDRSHWLENLGSLSSSEDLKTCPSKYLLNSLQLDVNFIKMLNEIVIRESCYVYKNVCDCSERERLMLKGALWKLQSYLLQTYDIQPDSLILEPEGYVKKFFMAWMRDEIVNLIPVKKQQMFVRELFWRYNELRTIYVSHLHSSKAKTLTGIKVQSFKAKAVIWVRYVWNRFPYIAPSSYLHLLVEHGEELLQVAGSLELSSFDNEANMLNPSVKATLVDNLKHMWLKTSPYLRKKGRSYRKTIKCSKCSKRGHATKNCPKRTA